MKLFYCALLLSIPFLLGFSNQGQPVASPEYIERATKFDMVEDGAKIYFRYDAATTLDDSLLLLKANGSPAGLLKPNQFTLINASYQHEIAFEVEEAKFNNNVQVDDAKVIAAFTAKFLPAATNLYISCGSKPLVKLRNQYFILSPSVCQSKSTACADFDKKRQLCASAKWRKNGSGKLKSGQFCGAPANWEKVPQSSLTGNFCTMTMLDEKGESILDVDPQEWPEKTDPDETAVFDHFRHGEGRLTLVEPLMMKLVSPMERDYKIAIGMNTTTTYKATIARYPDGNSKVYYGVHDQGRSYSYDRSGRSEMRMKEPVNGHSRDSILVGNLNCINQCIENNNRASVASEGSQEPCFRACGVNDISDQTKSQDISEYRESVKALCEADDPRAVQLLITALMRDIKVRTGLWACIIPALGRLGDPAAVPILEHTLMLEDDDWLGREMSAKALGRIGSTESITLLLKAVEHGYAREQVIGALARAADYRVIPVLISALQEGVDQKTVQVAMNGLKRFGYVAVPKLLDAFDNYSTEYLATQKRLRLCHLLGKSRDERAVRRLRKSLNDPDPAVKKCASEYVNNKQVVGTERKEK